MLQVKTFATWVKAHADTERGASLVEYALLVALIAVVCIVGIRALGTAANDEFDGVATELTGATP